MRCVPRWKSTTTCSASAWTSEVISWIPNESSRTAVSSASTISTVFGLPSVRSDPYALLTVYAISRQPMIAALLERTNCSVPSAMLVAFILPQFSPSRYALKYMLYPVRAQCFFQDLPLSKILRQQPIDITNLRFQRKE